MQNRILVHPMLHHAKRFSDFETSSFYDLCEYISYHESCHYPEEGYFSEIIEKLEGHMYSLKDSAKIRNKDLKKINENFAKYLRHNLDNIFELMSTMNEFSPEVGLFKIKFIQFEKDFKNNKKDTASLDDRISKFIKDLKDYINIEKLTKEKNKLRTRIVKNRTSLLQYVENLLNENFELEVIRFEVSYEANGIKKESIKGFAQYRDQLFYYLSKILLKDRLLGYVWKFQPQQKDGNISCHIILFLKVNESKLRNKELDMQDVKKEWFRLTNDQGGYWHCASYLRYRSLGAGLINNLDESKKNELKNAMKYLSNPDYFIRLDLPKGIRAYGRGEIKVQEK